MADTANKGESSGDHKAAEDILAQYLYSVGQGANGQWVERAALRRVWDHYFPWILKAVQEGHDWDDAAPHVLDYLRAIGALAGHYALVDGRHCINLSDMELAIAAVQAQYGNVRTVTLGVWCPPLA